MPMKPALATTHREDTMTLVRHVEATARAGNAYALALLPSVRALGRQAATLDDGIQTARSLLIDPSGPAARQRMELLADAIALRGDPGDGTP